MERTYSAMNISVPTLLIDFELPAGIIPPRVFFLVTSEQEYQISFSICSGISNLTVQISISAAKSNTESAPLCTQIYLLNIVERKFPFPFCWYYVTFDVCYHFIPKDCYV